MENGCLFATTEEMDFPSTDPRMTVIVDTREHPQAIHRILRYFEENGVRVIRSKLYVGDYQEIGNGLLVVDRKQNLTELAGNLTQGHKRFKDELERAKEAKIKLVVLCEHGGQIRSLEDVAAWQNPRLKESPQAITGERMARIMKSMSERYGVEWAFCDKRQTGRRILEILEGGKDVEN